MKKFFPQDTLSIDVMSLGVLILMCSKTFFSDIVFPFNSLLPDVFWITIFFLFSVLSIKQILLNKLTPIKALLQWVFGVFFTWLSLHSQSNVDIPMLILGLSNLYACIINFNLIKDALDDIPE
jgi:hypothetical protein